MDDKILIVSDVTMGNDYIAHLSLDDVNKNNIPEKFKKLIEEYDVVFVITQHKAKMIKNIFGGETTIYLDNLGSYLKSECYRL